MKIRLLAALAAIPLAFACTAGAEKAAPAAAEKKAAVGTPAADGTVEVHATAEGFTPARIEAKAGQKLKLVFVRDVEKTCMTGVVFPSLGIEKDLPLGQKVEVEVTAPETGTVGFQCPMGMGKSAIVVL